MFTPRDKDLERGWPGKIEGERVVQLAAQTLQAFFTGGGGAREHAEYALDDVRLRAPVLHPPSVRVFSPNGDFTFANPTSIYGPEDEVPYPAGSQELDWELRLAAVIGADGAIGGFTLMNDWIASDLPGVKARDFATSLGPVVLTPDEFEAPDGWRAMVAYAARNTHLVPGDVLAHAESTRGGRPLRAGDVVDLELAPFGVLRNTVVAPR
jgi:2-keto-4-pentenoate hydratase/2-oxohepta-3-ene-1,7-dioic acid hydratase in catechol pathway